MDKIIRKKNSNYSVIPNVFLRDKQLSLKAKGLLTLILSLPDNWDFSILGICRILKEGRTAVYSAIDELKEHGYCTTAIERDARGCIVGTNYTFFEEAHSENPHSENPHSENPHSENPHTVNQQQINKDIQNTDLTKTRVYKTLNNDRYVDDAIASPIQSGKNEKENDFLEQEKKVASLNFEKKEKEKNSAQKEKEKRFVKPTAEQVRAYCAEQGYTLDAELFVDYYESNGWRVGRNPMKDWKATVRTWVKKDKQTKNGNGKGTDYETCVTTTSEADYYGPF